MIRQDKQSSNRGRADAMRGVPPKCPKSLDPLSYSSGYIEGGGAGPLTGRHDLVVKG